MQEAEQSIDVVYLDLIHPVDNAAFGRAHANRAGEKPRRAPVDAGSDVDGGADTAYRRPTPDATREERLRRVQITGQPHGEHTSSTAARSSPTCSPCTAASISWWWRWI